MYIHILAILRLVPIVLLKLPIIMLWSNAPEFCLICSNYVPYVNHFMLHKFNIIFLLNNKIMSISCLHSFSTLQLYNYYKYVYQHFEFLFVSFTALVSIHIWQKILQIHLSHNPVQSLILYKFCRLFWHYPQCHCHPNMLKIMPA